MPSRCCVPNCKGNYDSVLKRVTIFKFPENVETRKKWIRAIPRKDFIPSKSSRVCEVHFKEDDIEKETWIYDIKTGEKITASLRYPRLKKNAVPSLFPGCPMYLSVAELDRESPDEKKIRMENEQLQQAIKLSKEAKETDDQKTKFSSYPEFQGCLKNFQVPDNWTVIEQPHKIIFARLRNCDAAVIDVSVVVLETLELKVFLETEQLDTWNNINFPNSINCLKELSSILEYLQTITTKTMVKQEYII